MTSTVNWRKAKKLIKKKFAPRYWTRGKRNKRNGSNKAMRYAMQWYRIHDSM